MYYTFQGKRPIVYAESLIESVIRKIPARDLPPACRFTYHQGVFLSGVEQIYEQNGNSGYTAYIDEYLNCVLNPDKTPQQVEGHFWISLDSLDFRQPGNLLFRKWRESGNEQYLKAIEQLCDSLKEYPTNRYGGFWHMKSQPDQMWLDSLYMVAPLLARYSAAVQNPEYGMMAVKQALLMYEHMCDKSDGMLFHGWDSSMTAPWANPETGLSAEKWGRAMGWFVYASAEIIEILGTEFAGVSTVAENLRCSLEALIKVQSEEGFWYQVINKPDAKGNWKETSCTCLIAAAMAKAVGLGILGKEKAAFAKRAFEAVVNHLHEDENGVVLDGICIGTCIDEGTYEHYIGRDTCANDLHGSGAYLLMCAAINRLSVE